MKSLRAPLAFAFAALAAACLAAAGARGAPGDDVVVIGDSLAVGMEAYLAPAIPDHDVRTDSEIGRGSPAAVEALAGNLTPDDEIIVFALGSNDDPSQPQVLADSLERANDLAAGRCLVVATLEVSAYSGVDEEPLNEVIRAFAAANPNVRVVEWAEAARADPGLLADGGHATAEGYELRASMFAEAIASCDGAAPGGTGGGDGIPNPDRETRPERGDRPEPAPEPPEPEPIGRDEAVDMLADALASQIAIGALDSGP